MGIKFLTFLLFRRPWLPIIHGTELLELGCFALKMEDLSLQSFAFLICAVQHPMLKVLKIPGVRSVDFTSAVEPFDALHELNF